MPAGSVAVAPSMARLGTASGSANAFSSREADGGLSGSAAGTDRVNVLPCPRSLVALIVPPSSALTSLAMDSPRPVPL